MGRDIGLRRHRGVPRVQRVELCYGNGDPDRRRFFNRGLDQTRNEPRFSSLIRTSARSHTMNLRKILIAAALAFSPGAALAQDSGWQRYVVPMTGAKVDIPAAIFSRDAGE